MEPFLVKQKFFHSPSTCIVSGYIVSTGFGLCADGTKPDNLTVRTIVELYI